MVIRHWLCAVILTLIAMGGIAHAQTPYKVDSSEHVGFLITGSIGSTQTPPYWIRLTTGAGASYARVGVPMLIELRDTTSDSAFYGKFELDSVSQIVGDSLYVVKRALSNSSKYSWSAGTRAQIVNSNSIIISALRRSSAATIGLPDTTGNGGKYLLDSANGIGPVWTTVPSTTVAGVASFNARTGVVVPTLGDYGFSKISGTAATTQGGTGLTSILPTKILYSPSSNTFGPLTLSSSFTITHDTLFGVGFQSALPDTTGNAGKVLKDSANGVGLIWSSAGAGTVQSVNVGGGLSGLTFSGGPITISGTAQISGGQLGVTYGGTGAGTAAQARVNLLPDTTGHTGQFLFLPPGGGISWDTAIGGGGGGVTSVNVAIPGMTSSGAITTSGTITMSGTLAVANGGTALSTTPTNGKLLIGNGTNYTLANLTGTSNEVTVTNGAGSITLATPQAIGTSSDVQFDSLTLLKPLPITSGGTGRSTVDTGALLYGYGASTMASLAAGADGTVLQIASGLPAYTATLSSTVQGNVTTLGTITSGTWSATTIAASKGGTGIASPTIHELLVGNGSSAMTQLAVGATSTVLHGHTGADPSFSAIAAGDIIDSNVTAAKIATGAVDLTQQVSGILPIGNGGTGLANIFGTANTWTAVQTVNKANIQTTYTDGMALTNATTSDVSHTVQQSPSLSFLSHVWNTTATATDSIEAWREQVIPVSGTSTTSSLTWDNGNTAGGFTNVASLSDAGAFNVKTGGSYQINGTSVLNATTLGSGVVNSSLTSVGTIATGVWHGTAVGEIYGGTNQTSYTTGNILYASASNTLSKLAIGSQDSIPLVVTTGIPSWGGKPIRVTNGGTGVGTFTAHSLIVGEGTAKMVALGSATNGQIPIGSTGVDPVLATLTGTANQVSVANGTGSITLSLPQSIATTSNVTFGLVNSVQLKKGSSVNSGLSITGGGWTGDATLSSYLAIGSSATLGSVSGGGHNCVALGRIALGSLVDGDYNIAIGANAAFGVTNNNGGPPIIAIGDNTFQTLPVAASNPHGSIAIGMNALNKSGANHNIALGYEALKADTTGADNVVIGYQAQVTGGYHNNDIIIGSGASLADGTTNAILLKGTSDFTHFYINGTTTDLLSLAGVNGGTGQTSYTTGDMLYASATNTLSKRAIGTTGDILTVAGGVPTWTATPTLSALNVTNGTTLLGAFNLHVQTTKTTTYTILGSDCVVPCDATSAGFTATLPAGATVGQVVIVSKIDGGINAVTVAPGAGQTIIAATGVLSGGNISLTTTNPNAHLCYIGSNNWILISRD